MTGGAGGPASEPARPPESASFEAAGLGGPRRVRPPVLGVAFIAVLGAVVAAGLSGRSAPGIFPVAGDELAAVTVGVSASPGDSPRPSLATRPLDNGPSFTSAPGLLQLTANRHATTVFVHGDVFVDRVTWVFVSVQNDIGQVAGWASVSVPGAGSAPPGGGPSLRFDVEVAIPANAARLWARAQAYDADGTLVGATSVELPTFTPIAS